MSINIKLKWHELTMAAHIGTQRQIESLRDDKKDKAGYDGSGWEINIEGAVGELVVAKYLNIYWDGSVNTYKSGHDVGGYEVRTRSKSWYELLIRPDDKDDAIYILVTGKGFDYKIRGWLLGKDAKRKEWFKAHGGRDPAYFAPQSVLHPMSELPDPFYYKQK
jgi:hypothetical protein